MPLDSTPRIAATFSTMPLAGTAAPGCPNTPTSPARALGAPQTTCNAPSPASTVSTCSLSACGCRSAVSTRATVKPDSRAAGSSTPSTSSPMRVSAATIASSGASVSRWSRSQESVNFIV